MRAFSQFHCQTRSTRAVATSACTRHSPLQAHFRRATCTTPPPACDGSGNNRDVWQASHVTLRLHNRGDSKNGNDMWRRRQPAAANGFNTQYPGRTSAGNGTARQNTDSVTAASAGTIRQPHDTRGFIWQRNRGTSGSRATRTGARVSASAVLNTRAM
jgi:hypothetical protein